MSNEEEDTERERKRDILVRRRMLKKKAGFMQNKGHRNVGDLELN